MIRHFTLAHWRGLRRLALRGFVRVPLTRKDSFQRRENTAVCLSAHEVGIVLQIKRQDDLPRENWTLEELQLGTPEIRIRLVDDQPLSALQNVSAFRLNANRGAALIGRGFAVSLDCHQRGDDENQTQDQPLTFEN